MGRVIVFDAKQDNKAGEPVSFTVRVRGFGSNAGQSAAQGISSAAQTAATGVSKGVRQGVDVNQKKSRSMLTWSLLAAAVVATAGAVAALVRYRYSSSIEVDAEEEFGPVGQAGTDTGGTSTQATAPAEGQATGGQGPAGSESADAGVDGRVSSSGW
jgi:hypothetical protein